MIELNEFKIRIVNFNLFELSWSIQPTQEDLSVYEFHVLRSDSPEEGFQDVSGPLVDQYIYLDEIDDPQHQWRIFYYKLRIYNTQTLEESFSDAIYWHEDTISYNLPDPVLEIVRKNNWILSHSRYRVGRKCKVLIKKTFGQICTNCWDPIKERVTDDQCEICYGTGYVGGYYSPIKTYVAFEPLTKRDQIQVFGKLQPGEIVVWMSNYPLVKPGDLIYNVVEGNLYRVNDVKPTKHLIIVHQTMRLTLLPKDHIAYKLVS